MEYVESVFKLWSEFRSVSRGLTRKRGSDASSEGESRSVLPGEEAADLLRVVNKAYDLAVADARNFRGAA